MISGSGGMLPAKCSRLSRANSAAAYSGSGEDRNRIER
jgi:hypothetical protein